MTSRGIVMTSRDIVMTSRDIVMTSRDIVMTSRDILTFSYHSTLSRSKYIIPYHVTKDSDESLLNDRDTPHFTCGLIF